MIDFSHSFFYLNYLLVLASATLISYLLIPSVLHIAKVRGLYDDAFSHRKQHDHDIPRLGGIAIFVGFLLTLIIFKRSDDVLPSGSLVIAGILLFVIGLKDDLTGVNPGTKFIIQLISALVVVFATNIKISGMYGVFGVGDFSTTYQSICSVMLLLLIINTFNLIDGIDGLAGLTGMLVNGIFFILFLSMRQYELAMVSLTVVGAIFGFLPYNLRPAKIFMGDTGALLIGLISAVLAIKFMEINKSGYPSGITLKIGPALAVSLFIGLYLILFGFLL